jgi:hypothetical protein
VTEENRNIPAADDLVELTAAAYTPPVKPSGRVQAAKTRPRNAKGQLIRADGKEEAEPETIGSEQEMVRYLFGCLGGWKKALRMYAKAIRNAPDGKKLDALYDVFKLVLKEQASELTEEDAAAMSDEDLAKLALKYLPGRGT